MNSEDLEYDYYEEMPSPATMEKKKRKRRRIIIRVISWALVIVLAVIVLGAGTAIYMVNRGGKTLQEKTQGSAPVLEAEADTILEGDAAEAVRPTEKPIEWQADWVQYGDTIYDYNENIMTFLVMGIDKAGEVKLTDKPAAGGQSDAMFLVVVNPDKEQIDLIGINRDTMVDVYCYGYEVNGEVPVL